MVQDLVLLTNIAFSRIAPWTRNLSLDEPNLINRSALKFDLTLTLHYLIETLLPILQELISAKPTFTVNSTSDFRSSASQFHDGSTDPP